jgi:hypothetical protein
VTVAWLHEVRSAEGLRFRIGRRAEVRIAQWDGMLRLEVGPDGPPIVAVERESLGVEKLRHGAVPALLGHLTGNLHWHAAACCWPNEASVMVLGDAGAGKSTLVSGLCNEAGACFLADDVLLVEASKTGWESRRREEKHAVRPDMAALLFDHVARDKALFAPSRVRRRAPLGMIVGLAVGDDFALREISARQKVQLLTRNLVRFALDDPDLLQRDLDVVLRLAAEVPVYSLVRPRAFSDWKGLAGLLRPRLRGVLKAT